MNNDDKMQHHEANMHGDSADETGAVMGLQGALSRLLRAKGPQNQNDEDGKRFVQ